MLNKNVDISILEGEKHILIQGDLYLLRQILREFGFDVIQGLISNKYWKGGLDIKVYW